MGVQQYSLFATDNTAIASLAGVARVVCAAMNEAARTSPYSRPQIADRMNHYAHMAGVKLTQGNARSISVDTLDKWLNPESGYTPNLAAVDAFMWACNSLAPLTAWAGLHGAEFLAEDDRYYRDLGKALEHKQDAIKQYNNLAGKRGTR